MRFKDKQWLSNNVFVILFKVCDMMKIEDYLKSFNFLKGESKYKHVVSGS